MNPIFKSIAKAVALVATAIAGTTIAVQSECAAKEFVITELRKEILDIRTSCIALKMDCQKLTSRRTSNGIIVHGNIKTDEDGNIVPSISLEKRF